VEQAGAGYCQVFVLAKPRRRWRLPIVVGEFEAEAVGFVFVVAREGQDGGVDGEREQREQEHEQGIEATSES